MGILMDYTIEIGSQEIDRSSSGALIVDDNNLAIVVAINNLAEKIKRLTDVMTT